MKRKAAERLATKRQLFIERTHALYPELDMGLFAGKPSLAVRVNTLKSANTQTEAAPIAWAPHCYFSSETRESLTSREDFEDGRIYLQNPSSFIPPIVMDIHPNERVLDMCAAPGGKASHIATLANNNIELWINDNSKSRLLRMQRNLARLRVKTHNETMFGVERIARELPHNYFDKILLDAPCSGEGALRLNDDASLEYWSVAHIKRLQKIQRQAISAAWQLLKPGGTLVYSTCTMAPEENEAVIDWLLRKQAGVEVCPINLAIPEVAPAVLSWQGKAFADEVSLCLRIKPTKTMEAFFVAKINKAISSAILPVLKKW